MAGSDKIGHHPELTPLTQDCGLLTIFAKAHTSNPWGETSLWVLNSLWKKKKKKLIKADCIQLQISFSSMSIYEMQLDTAVSKKRSSQTVCSFHPPTPHPPMPWSNMKPRQASVALTPYGLRKILAVTINDFFQHCPSASSDQFPQCSSPNSWPCTRTYEKSEWRWMLCGMALCLETAFSAALAMRDAYRSFQLETFCVARDCEAAGKRHR